MKLGIMQPYFFPYLGYFDLINQTEEWIVFDTVQYIRHGWVNRNRVLHPKQGWQYVIVPVKKHSQSTLISETEIMNDGGKWREKIIGQLQHYKRRAPFFQEAMALVKGGVFSENTSIARLNVNCLSLVCEYLGIEFRYQYFSDMHLDLGPIDGPGDWALRISEAMGATEYINPLGGVGIFAPEKFHAAGIKRTIRQLPPMEYQCSPYEFIPNLSIIDVLMWNEPEKVREHLEKHR